MKIAILSTIIPNVLRTGSEIATFAIVQALETLGHEVTVFAYGRTMLPVRSSMPAVLLATIPITTAETPLIHRLRWLARSALSGLPISSEKFNYVAPDRIAAAVFASGAELVLADHINLFPFVRELAPRLPLGMMFHDIHAVMYGMVADAATRPWWRAIYRREARLNAILEREAGLVARFSWFLSKADAGFARDRLGNPQAIALPLFYPFATDTPQARTAAFDVGLIGTWDWPPVAEGMRWFLDDVLPRLPADITVAVAGQGSQMLPGGRVERLGIVPDARAFLAGCRVSAVPAVAGTGLQIKTLELAATGMPAVSTPLGVRGLDELPPTLLVADGAEAFAASLVDLVTSRRAAAKVGPEAGTSWNARRRAAVLDIMRESLGQLLETRSTSP